MSDQRRHQKQQGAGDQQKPGQQQLPNQKPGQARNEQRDQQKQKGGHGDQQQHLTPDQISFYDETLKKQIEGSYRTDGRSIHVSSVKYGIKSAPYGHLGTFVDKAGLDLLAQKLLSELARDGGKPKDVQQHKDDQQRQGESFSAWGQGAVGTNP
jgi:hypothetical protein